MGKMKDKRYKEPVLPDKLNDNGTCMLAAAIISRGEYEHDETFLESDWCDTLRKIIKYAPPTRRRK